MVLGGRFWGSRDYNGETYKYFLPDENLSHKAEMNEDPNEWQNIEEYGKIRCKCMKKCVK